MSYVIEEELESYEDGDEPSYIFSPSYNQFKTSVFPILIVSKQFEVKYLNEACKQMFAGFSNLLGKNFLELFGKAFDDKDVIKIREIISAGSDEVTWKGSARLSSRDTVSVQVKVNIFPLEMNLRSSNDFVIMFDDFTEENKILLRSVFLSLLEASKYKDNDPGNHTTRVNEYSKRLAQELQKTGIEAYKCIDDEYIDNIGFLAALHDVGKIGTLSDILNKGSPLSDWEWIVMREHTKNGAYILSTYPNPMAKEIALSHHEKWDGTGYPFQLEGEMIPLAGRIVSIADVYDALRMERTYKPALSHEVSIQKIIEMSGTSFDPQLIEVLKTISGDFEKIYSEYAD
jgi:putative two-component system response regulator